MTLLQAEELTVHFRVRRGLTSKSADTVHAADGVNLSIEKAETLALVGESGCGKTTVALAILGLVKATGGTIRFMDQDVTRPADRKHAGVVREMQVVFQDPYSSLDPRMTVHDLVAEPLRAQRQLGGRDLRERVVSLLDTVGLGTQHLYRKPHEFSGGQCQRIAIARALALEPALVILDEPTSALDVSVQARILLLLNELQERLGLAYLFIAHDLAVVESMATRVAVMYLGCIVEEGPVDAVLDQPLHPYCVALLASVPSPDPERRSTCAPLVGDVPSAINPPSGCRFHPRCPYCMDVCREEKPTLRQLCGRNMACHLPEGVPS